MLSVAYTVVVPGNTRLILLVDRSTRADIFRPFREDMERFMDGKKRRVAYKVANNRNGGLNEHFAGVMALKPKSAGAEKGRFLRSIFDFAVKEGNRAVVL